MSLKTEGCLGPMHTKDTPHKDILRHIPLKFVHPPGTLLLAATPHPVILPLVGAHQLLTRLMAVTQLLVMVIIIQV